ARIVSPPARCPPPRATCPFTWPPPSRLSSSGRYSCSISARTTRAASRAVMADLVHGRARTIEAAARELCLAFPDVEEFESHGAPNYRTRKGKARGKIFAVWALNHHGDGHV